MLVKLTNTGDAMRVVSDINKVAHNVRPGQTLPIDLEPNAVKKYMRAMDTDKSTVRVELEDDWPEGEEPKGHKPFTHREPAVKSQPRMLSEVDGDKPGMRQRAHKPPARQEGDEIEHDAPNDDSGTVETGKAPAKRTPAEPMKALNDRRNAPETTKATDRDEPKTAAELIDRIGDYSEEDKLRLAKSVLPRGFLPSRPKPSQIMDALRKQAKIDAEKVEKTKKRDRVRVNRDA